MSVKLNHTIVYARDKRLASTFLAEILGLPQPTPFGPFDTVQVDNDVTLDYYQTAREVEPQHYAFLVDEADFDAIFSGSAGAV